MLWSAHVPKVHLAVVGLGMHVIVDGIVYARQRYGGINTYFNEVLPRIARYPDTRVDLLLPGVCAGPSPGPPVHAIPRDFIPRRTGLSWRLDNRIEPLLERLKLALFGVWAKAKANVVFHSSYFTSLPVPIPHVAMAHDMNHELLPELYTDPRGVWLRRRYREYLQSATRIISVSETTKKHVQQYYGIAPSMIDVVHLAVSPSSFYVDRREERLPSLTRHVDVERPYVLYVGGRWHYKNFPIVLEAVGGLYRRTGLTLVVAGPAWNETESLEIQTHAAAPAMRLVPDPDNGLLRLLYSFAAAFIFPSRHEGFGIPLLEAMACGAPVVASDTSIFREVAGDAAIYFNPYDSDDLARAIEACLDQRTARQYRERGLAQAAKYSWDRAAAQTRAAYEVALAHV